MSSAAPAFNAMMDLALLKTTAQSGNLSSNTTASKANDGQVADEDRGYNFAISSCAITAQVVNPWW